MQTSSELLAARSVPNRWLRLAGIEPCLRPLPRDRPEFDAWRAELLKAVRQLAGSGPDDVMTAWCGPVPGTSTGANDCEGLIREEHLISGDGGAGAFRAVVTYPAGGRGSFPAVVVCPGRNAVVDQVTGARAPDYPDRNVAEHFARAGFLTLTVDYGLDGLVDPASLAGRDEAALIAQLLALNGVPLLGMLAGETLRSVSFLAAHPAAMPGRIALFGHSLGGAVALHAALLAGRPMPLCVASHLGSYRVVGRGHAASALPGIARYADLPDLFAAHAPAPLQLQFGTRDTMLSPDDAAAAGEQVRHLYRVAGAAGLAEVLALPMGHGTGVAAATGFLRRALDGADAVGATSAPPISPIPPAREELC
jgi:perosamine synthetase